MSLPLRLLLTAVFTALFLWGPAHIEQVIAPTITAPAHVTNPAPLYSKRCMARDRDFAAGQADGGAWQGTCTTKRIAL